MKVKLLLLLVIHMLFAAQDKQDNKEAEVIRDIKPDSTSAPVYNVCVSVKPTGADATLHTVAQKGVEAFMAKLAKGGDADARIVEMGDCQAETSEEKGLGMRLAIARTGEQEEMEPLSSDPDCHEFEMAVAFAGTPGDHFSAEMHSAKLSIGEADEEKQMMMGSSSAAQLLSVQVGEKDGLTHAFFSVKINMNRLTILKPCWILVNLDVVGVRLQRRLLAVVQRLPPQLQVLQARGHAHHRQKALPLP